MTLQIPKDIENYPFEPIVVGAGINGSGIARDARTESIASRQGGYLRRPPPAHDGRNEAEAAADVAAKHLGWSGEGKQKEVEAYRWYVQRYRPKDTRQMKG